MVMFKEYAGHVLIGSPLERPVRVLRDLAQLWQRRKTPELSEIYAEPLRMEQVMELAIKDGMNCIDVGSHLGSMISIITRKSPKGKHIAVEPVPYKANWLKQKYPNVEVLQIALSEFEGEAEFFFQPFRSAYSGLRLNGSNDEKFELLTVKCKRLDDIVRDRPIGFMKVVAEGAELGILKGGEEILQRYHPTILFDCINVELQRFNVTSQDFYDFLVQKHSYSVFLLKDWLKNGEPLSYEAFAQAMQYPFQAFRFLAVYKT